VTIRREIPGLVVTEREHLVPLDHADPDGPRIGVFTRELADPEGEDRPLLVFFEGGPGSEAPRPSRTAETPPWLERALKDFRVLMLDQRGTGRSSPIGTRLPGAPQEQAEYLAHFRADSIVADADFDEPTLEPLREAAELLAQREWPALYDIERLRSSEVPGAAVVYSEDPYVERTFSEQAVALIPGLRMWLTSEYDHDGLRRDGERLLDLARGRI
jgi:hypothetical protein